MSDGLACECLIPFAWRATDPDAPGGEVLLRGEAALLLVAINQLEAGHELESSAADSRLERIEAKLDLALHLLARVLNTGPAPAVRHVRLTPEGAEWNESTPPPEGTRLILEFHLSEALPLSVKLTAIAIASSPDLARAQFTGLGGDLEDALYQFVFRRHRQAIRSKYA
jgi:hypothetical protein